ncbi:hypothetical protein CDAR_54111 [Caerostris darwini]|uniref:Uncharacterized protein n=1 Tax=Caerostris darwini TaxID=1538125 RepID=A0AAV4N2S2_9ARAC|nr:hypothetical protein CDAR_54111 [Caerostris darwini]
MKVEFWEDSEKWMTREQRGRVDEGDEVQGSGRYEALVRDIKASGLKIISSQMEKHRHQIGSSNLSPESLPNHHLASHGATFPENPSTLSQTQPSRHPRQREISQLVEFELIRRSRNMGSITSKAQSYVSDVGK